MYREGLEKYYCLLILELLRHYDIAQFEKFPQVYRGIPYRILNINFGGKLLAAGIASIVKPYYTSNLY